LNLQVNVSPSYEIRPKIGRKETVFLGIFFAIGILLLVTNIKEASPLMIIFISVLTAVPAVLIAFSQRARWGRDGLIQFVNSISDVIKHWALERTAIGEYSASCELKDDYFLKFRQDVSYHAGYNAVLLSVSRFTTRPEAVFKAPYVKVWNENYVMPFLTTLPLRNEEIELWKNSSEKWRRLISEDEVIRSWMARHCDWKSIRYAPTARGIYSIGMEACHGYKRNPSVRDGWLKGRWLTANFIFRIPTNFDANQLRTFYVEMIDIGKRIIQHVAEGKGLVFSNENIF